MYEVIWGKRAFESLSKLEPLISRRIFKLVKEFSNDPESKNVRRLRGENAFRLRAGDYRIIIDIEHNKKLIKVLKVGHRKNIYER